jgi:hypothetical protein
VKKNRGTALAVTAGTAAIAGGIYMQEQRERRDKELQKVDPNYGKTPSPQKSIIDFGSGNIGFSGGGMIPVAKAFAGGGKIDSIFSGLVGRNSGTTVSGAGPDTQFFPIEDGGGAVLQRGESVLQVGAREKIIKERGFDPLAYNTGANANNPKFVNNIQMAAGGGIIGKGFKSPSIQMGSPNIRMPNIGGFNSRITNRQSGSNINIRGSRPLMNSFASKSYSGSSGSGFNNTLNYSGMSGSSGSKNFMMNQSSPMKMGKNTTSFTQNIFSASAPSSNISYSPVNISTQINPSQRKPVSPGPPVANNARSSFIELPPIVKQATQQGPSGSGTKTPPFMAPDSTMASINASIYGIV